MVFGTMPFSLSDACHCVAHDAVQSTVMRLHCRRDVFDVDICEAASFAAKPHTPLYNKRKSPADLQGFCLL